MNPLYHFTSIYHLPQIRADGFLALSDSCIGSTLPALPPCGVHIGPDVVWLTDQPNARGHGLDLGPLDRLRVRFTVEVKNAEPWKNFAMRHGINRQWYRELDKMGGFTARHWRVTETPIAAADWLEVVDMRTGNPIRDEDVPDRLTAALARLNEAKEIVARWQRVQANGSNPVSKPEWPGVADIHAGPTFPAGLLALSL